MDGLSFIAGLMTGALLMIGLLVYLAIKFGDKF